MERKYQAHRSEREDRFRHIICPSTRRAFKLDEQSDRLTLEDLALCEGLLSALPAKEIAQRFEQQLERAVILPAGGLIIQAVMQYLHINEIRVSSHGVREGVLLAYTRYGEHWQEEVKVLQPNGAVHNS